MPRIGFAVLGIAGLLLCRAAAGEEEGTKSGGGEAEALRERVVAYWDARVERSEKVYDFYPSPELGGPKDRKMIGEFGNVLFESYRIEDIKVEGDSANVHLTVKVHVTPLVEGGAKEQRHEMPMRETWNRTCGTWYRKPLRRSLVKREFDPSELGSVGEGGPDCSKVSGPKAAAEAALPASKKKNKGGD